MRVGEEVEPEKLEELDVDQWMTGPWAGQQHTDNLSKLKLYAYACKQQLGENDLLFYSILHNQCMDPNIFHDTSFPSGPQLAALPLDSSLLLPPKPQPPVNNTSSAQPASSGQTQTWAPDGEQAQGTVSSANDPTPTSGQSGETSQGGASESKGTSSATPPANTPAENPEL